MTKRKFCLIVNPYAGNGEAIRVLKQVEQTLKVLPIDFHIVISKDVADAQTHALNAVNQGEYVAVLGGDGSASTIAEALRNQHGTLAIIPAGRGNDFARMLKYPQDPIEACRILAYGQEKVVDMGQANEKPFLGICSLGFDSIANKIANQTTIIKGRAVYIYAALRALFQYQPALFHITIDGKKHEYTAYTIAVANSQCYGGGMFLAPNASIEDELLDIVIIGAIPKHRLLFNLPRVFKGTHINEPNVTVLRGRNVHIEAEPQYMAFADGDAVCSSPLNIQVLPKSLRVLVPN